MEKILLKVFIVGSGFVGLTTGCSLAEKNISINIIDIDHKKINDLKKGIISFHEKGLDSLLKKLNIKKKIKFQSNYNNINSADIIFICVDTPFDSKTKNINLSQLYSVSNTLFSQLDVNSKKIIVIKSTVTPGTTEIIKMKFNKKFNNILFCNNPEFLREGSALDDFRNSDRIVIGSDNEDSFRAVSSLYKKFKAPVFQLSITEAEYSKYISNIFFANLISFTNEFADSISVNRNVNYYKILETLKYDKRIAVRNNNKIFFPSLLSYLTPGAGFGGSCFPKDTMAFKSFQEKNQKQSLFTSAIIRTNHNRIKIILKILSDNFKINKNSKICILGISFKPNSDDLRNSQSINLFKHLSKKQKNIYVIDSIIKSEYAINKYNIKPLTELYDNFSKIIILMTASDEFNHIKWKKLDGKVNLIIDMRNAIKYNFIKTKLITCGIS